MESIIQLIGNLIGDFNEWLKSIIAFDDNFYNIYNIYYKHNATWRNDELKSSRI